MLSNLDTLVADNIRTLSLPKEPLKRPLVVIFVAPPLSDLPSLVSEVAQTLPVIVLSYDTMASYLAPKATFFHRGEEEVTLLAFKTIEALVAKGVSCVYDTSLPKRRDRLLLAQKVKAAGGHLVVISIEPTKKTLRQALEEANTQIVQGEKKGFIMDQDLFNYEMHTLDLPTTAEHPFRFHPDTKAAPITLAHFLKEVAQV